jgi:chloramphenicol 3-O-phosphotransferase
MAETAVFLLTGASASGKSTVGKLLAERFDRGVHLEGDVFRRSIVSGRVEMTEGSPEALRQLRVRYRLAAAAGDAYVVEGFTVVVEDVVAGRLLEEFVSLVVSRPLHVVVLAPGVEIVAARETARRQDAYAQFPMDELHRAFVDDTPRIGLWLDNAEQTPEETVDAILDHKDRSLVAV